MIIFLLPIRYFKRKHPLIQCSMRSPSHRKSSRLSPSSCLAPALFSSSLAYSSSSTRSRGWNYFVSSSTMLRLMVFFKAMKTLFLPFLPCSNSPSSNLPSSKSGTPFRHPSLISFALRSPPMQISSGMVKMGVANL